MILSSGRAFCVEPLDGAPEGETDTSSDAPRVPSPCSFSAAWRPFQLTLWCCIGFAVLQLHIFNTRCLLIMSDAEKAAACKAKGNAALAEGKFAEAVEAYTEAIAIDATNHVFYSNRSAAYLSMGDAEHALEDAEACVKAKPDWAKGYGRKGAALHKLQRYKDAIDAYNEGEYTVSASLSPPLLSLLHPGALV